MDRVAVRNRLSTGQLRLICLSVVVLFSCFRLAHVHLLWADEDYHLAATLQILDGKIPYRDFWYDKPPLSAFYYLSIAGRSGWPLRLLDAAYILLACTIAFTLAQTLWTELEGWAAALFVGFFTTFYLPSAVIPFAADAVMLVPHLAAVYCAATRRAFWAGAWTGVALLANAKALFVLLACAVWLWPEWLALLSGFALVSAVAAIAAIATGAWSGYVQQVWQWGLIYAKDSPVANPILNGSVRTLDWTGFHAALVLCAACGLARVSRDLLLKLLAWIVLSVVAVALGSRFAPHYFLQLLPALAVPAARGCVLALAAWRQRAVIALAALCLVPLVRFGPRYVSLATDDLLGRKPNWSDVAMDLDSQDVARDIEARRKPNDTLFVWGYRPDIYVYTRMVPDGRFWDSQPLTGVPADRHLRADHAILNGPAAANRIALISSRPDWIVDGLGLLNPRLSPTVYPELRPWLAHYQLVCQTKLSLIYRRAD